MLKASTSPLASWLLLAALSAGGASAQVPAPAALPGSGPVVQAKPTPAAPPPKTSGPAWRTLTPQQQQALAPLERDWPGIDASRKAKWLDLSSRFASMPPDEQQRVQARMAEWARLTPSERGQARLSFQESKQLTREEKQQRWDAYQALPEEERRALAAKARPDESNRSAPAARSATAQAQRSTTAPGASAPPPVKPVAPTIVQAKPGATTTAMTKPAAPPPHQQPGQPKIAAQPDKVDRQTLLPKSGPQAAAPAPRTP